jgi:ATP-dependent Clp protease adapter protein ClpS
MNTRKRRKKVTLHLYNDDYNSMEYVIDVLSRFVPNCNKLKAEQLTILAHNHLCTEICSGFSPEIYQIQANLIRAGLIVETNNFLDD